MRFPDESRSKRALRLRVRVVATSAGTFSGLVVGVTVHFAWHQLGGSVFFQDASTFGDLPSAYRAVSGIAAVALTVWGGVLRARFGRRLVNRPRIDDLEEETR